MNVNRKPRQSGRGTVDRILRLKEARVDDSLDFFQPDKKIFPGIEICQHFVYNKNKVL